LKRIDLMRSVRIFLAHWYVLGAGLGLSLTAAGCDGGGSGKTEMIKPAVPPQEAGKDSMDYYKSQMKGGAKKK
jgi:hypothetical protein